MVDALVAGVFWDEARVVKAMYCSAHARILERNDLSAVGSNIQWMIAGGSAIGPTMHGMCGTLYRTA